LNITVNKKNTLKRDRSDKKNPVKRLIYVYISFSIDIAYIFLKKYQKSKIKINPKLNIKK